MFRIACIMLCLLTAVSASAAESGLLAHYRFDEGDGNVRCKVSKANDGTFYGAWFVKMPKGHAAGFGGSSYVKLAGTKLHNFGAGDFTLDLWLKLDAIQSGTIYGKKGKTPNSAGWHLAYDQDAEQLTFNIADGKSQGKIAARLADRKWHHVAAVRSGRTASLYIDGEKVAGDTQPIFAANVDNNQVFPQMGKIIGFETFKGKLDEVRLYTKALNPGSITAHYRSQNKNMAAADAQDKTALDDPLVLHYTFDADTGDTVKDNSPYGHDAKIENAKHLASLDGRSGVMRFDGKTSILNCPRSDALMIDGDMSFEMWVRENDVISHTWGVFFGDTRDFDFYFAGYHSLVLWYVQRHPQHKNESMLLPVDRYILSRDKWAHIAVVVEYPRCKFYHNGKMIRDAYMPLPGIPDNVNHPYVIGKNIPIDLDEFRLYNRSLTAQEVAAHAAGRDVSMKPTVDLAIEPHWYDKTVTVRTSIKGADYHGHSAQFDLSPGGDAQSVQLVESFKGSGRYVASAVYPLSSLVGKTVAARVNITDIAGKQVNTADTRMTLTKPHWVNSPEGHTDKVPIPWTPVTTKETGKGVEIGVWGRQYAFTDAPFPVSISAQDEELLASPIALAGKTDGKAIQWSGGRVAVKSQSDVSATLRQSIKSDAISWDVDTTVEFDGYIIFDCELKAQRDVTLDELTLRIPMRTRFAALCYGDRVYPKRGEIENSVFQSGAVKGDLSFRFGSTIWLGVEARGLCWQTESDEHWHYGDPNKALQVIVRGDTTTLKANFVDLPTKLKAGDTLQYKFALQGTPIKPMLRDPWDLRIVRAEPYGGELGYPDNNMGGKPALEYLAESGVRHLFTTGCDRWPYPLPVGKKYARLLRRLNDQSHAHGLKIYNYQLHERYPTEAPEFDIHGMQMSMRPMNQYLPGNNPPDYARQGPVPTRYGASSQGTVFFCPKSEALRDACIDALAKRTDQYGDDGVYLDGTNACPPCQNLDHGCGYVDEDGVIHKTVPVFGARELSKRIYIVIKSRKPEGVVDAHCSFGYNIPSLGFSDIIWTGEQWYHLRKTGSSYIAGDLSLDQYRTEFMGTPIGVAAETLAYRLGTTMKVSAISLLHDIPNRPSTPGFDKDKKPNAKSNAKPDHFQLMVRLWKVRDEFAAHEAEKLFYWENQDYVTVSPDKCYSTLLKHPTNGVLAFISNLAPDKKDVTVRFNLETLGLKGKQLKLFDALEGQAMELSSEDALTVPLDSMGWCYVWLRPA